MRCRTWTRLPISRELPALHAVCLRILACVRTSKRLLPHVEKNGRSRIRGRSSKSKTNVTHKHAPSWNERRHAAVELIFLPPAPLFNPVFYHFLSAQGGTACCIDAGGKLSTGLPVLAKSQLRFSNILATLLHSDSFISVPRQRVFRDVGNAWGGLNRCLSQSPPTDID